MNTPSMPQSDIREQIKKCFTDSYMENEGETELFDTDQTIENMAQLITNHTNAAVIAAEDKWFQWMINEVGYERARQYKDIAALGVKDGNN